MQLGDFLTAVQRDLPIKLVVLKNNTLGLTMKDVLDESSFDASPAHVIPGRLGDAAEGVVRRRGR